MWEETHPPPDGITEGSRKVEKYGCFYPRRVFMHTGEDEIHLVKGQ